MPGKNKEHRGGYEMKKRGFQKHVAVLMGAMLMTASLAACGGGNKSGGKQDSGEPKLGTEQKEFSILGGQSALSPGYADNEVLNKLQENAGIKINWNTMSDSLSEQVNIHIAGGDLPDAFMGVGFTNYELSKYGADGTFIDLTPYITAEYMPNLTKVLEEHPDVRAAITMDDGHIYGLPSGEQMGTAGIGKEKDYSIFTVPQFSMINKAWLDDLGLPVPTTLDELHTALKAFKDNDMAHKMYGAAEGSTIPMSTGYDQWCWGQNIFYAGFGFTNWINDVCADLVLMPDGKVNFVSDDDGYREALTYFHDWYAEGLMDVEMFSQSDTQLMSKCQQGYVGVSTWWYIDELMGDYAKDYVFLPVLNGPSGTNNVTVRTGGGTSSGNLSITSKCESPVNLLKFFDQWYDGETVMQLQYGPIGVYFTGQDANGVWNSITEAEARAKFGKGAGELKSTYEVAGPKLILSSYYRDNFHMEDRAVERLTDLYDVWMPQVKNDTTYPVDCVFTSEELETIDRYRTDFENVVAEQEGLWIKDGGPTDAEWEAYKKKLVDSCGMDELLKVYQAAYDRYLAAKK
jgi:extracellular solute-binding protein family 1